MPLACVRTRLTVQEMRARSGPAGAATPDPPARADPGITYHNQFQELIEEPKQKDPSPILVVESPIRR